MREFRTSGSVGAPGSNPWGDPTALDALTAGAAEENVTAALERASFNRDHVAAICFDPELEAVFVPVWGLVLERIAARRGRNAPTEAEITTRLATTSTPVQQLLRDHPKEMFDAALSVLNLRHSSELFEDMGAHVSISQLKAGDAFARMTSALVRWFGGE